MIITFVRPGMRKHMPHNPDEQIFELHDNIIAGAYSAEVYRLLNGSITRQQRGTVRFVGIDVRQNMSLLTASNLIQTLRPLTGRVTELHFVGCPRVDHQYASFWRDLWRLPKVTWTPTPPPVVLMH